MYSVRKVKTFVGHDGHGFNTELCRDGKPVAFCTDLADGGEMRIDWYDRKEPRVKIQGLNYMKEPYEFEGTAEQKIMMDYCKTLPVEKIETGSTVLEITVSCDILVGDLVNEYEEEKRFKKLCKKNTLVKEKDGNIYTLKIPYTPQIKEKILQKYPNIVEFINEKYC